MIRMDVVFARHEYTIREEITYDALQVPEDIGFVIGGM